MRLFQHRPRSARFPSPACMDWPRKRPLSAQSRRRVSLETQWPEPDFLRHCLPCRGEQQTSRKDSTGGSKKVDRRTKQEDKGGSEHIQPEGQQVLLLHILVCWEKVRRIG